MRLALLDPETRFEHMLARDLGHGSIATMRRRLTSPTTAPMVRSAGHEAEGRRFRPHVTVARVRGRLRPFELPAPPSLEFHPPSVTLYRSVLGRGPATYEAMASVPLSTLP